MNLRINWSIVTAVIVLLAILGVGAWYFFGMLIAIFSGLEQSLTAILVTTLLAAAILAFGLQRIGRRVNADQLHQHKAHAYGRLLAALMGITDRGTRVDLRELQAAEQELLLWGSSAVIRSYTVLRSLGWPLDLSEPESEVSFLLEKLVRDMRKDLGQYNLGLE